MTFETEGRPCLPVAVALLACSIAVPVASAGERVSLDMALREARTANARLPLPALEVTVAAEREKEARAERWLKVAIEGDFIYAPPGYSPVVTNLGDARIQAVVRQPIYAGGALKAGVERAGANSEAARARYRMAEKDLELEVRSRFSEGLAADSEVEIRRTGLEQLNTYRSSLRSRQASGQGMAADLLKTDVRLALEEATLAEAEQHQAEARLSLNELMGRDPASPLELEPLAPPAAPAEADPLSWRQAPEIGAAEAVARAAAADATIARSERLPHLLFVADGGLWTDNTTHLGAHFWDRLWRDAGYSLSLVLVFPVWDTGVARARTEQASLGLQQARLQLEIERRDARLAWEKAYAALAHLYKQIAILSRALPGSRDSYLDAQSRYLGGAATAFEVLEAHSSAVDVAVRRSDAVARYRIAEAVALRWSTP